MSFDLRVSVKVDRTDIYAVVGQPEYNHPTYNIGKMLRECTGWEFNQRDHYNCEKVIKNIEKGIYELRTNEDEYKKYNAENGWGTTRTAIEALESLRECIYEYAETIPIKHLWVSW